MQQAQIKKKKTRVQKTILGVLLKEHKLQLNRHMLDNALSAIAYNTECSRWWTWKKLSHYHMYAWVISAKRKKNTHFVIKSKNTTVAHHKVFCFLCVTYKKKKKNMNTITNKWWNDPACKDLKKKKRWSA